MLQVFSNANFPLMGRVKWVFIIFSSLAVVAAVATMLTSGFLLTVSPVEALTGPKAAPIVMLPNWRPVASPALLIPHC